MVKVCHMTSAHGPEDGRIFRKECISLSKGGYDVYLVERGDSYEKEGVHIVGVGRPSGGRLARMTTFTKKVYEAALEIDADIYQFHDPELLPYGLKLKNKGKKVIFDSHELYSEQLKRKPYLPEWCTQIIAKVYTVYERIVLRNLDAVILPSLRDGKHPFEGLCCRAITISNFPQLEELYDHYDENAQKHERSVIHVGSLTYARGITHAIQAAAKSKSTIYLGGVFSPSSYQKEVETMPEYSSAVYLGQLNRQQVLSTLQSCQIGVATLLNIGQYNKADTLATKTYEYMAMGIPSIMSRFPYGEKVITQYGFGICVDPENVDEIADAITYLLDNPEEAKRMGENGRRAIKEEFNWEVEEKKLLSLYEDILKD